VRLVAALTLLVLHGVALAAPQLELRVDQPAERIDATVTGTPRPAAVFLRDVARGNRVVAVSVTATSDGFTATFDLRTLSPDGKSHVLAIESDGGEVARTSLVLPAGDQPSGLRWLVIIGPLLGLLMIGLAIYIGRWAIRRG
jgi:hypothetical protein